MVYINQDYKVLKENSERIISISKDYKKEINDFFSDLNKIKDKWKGNDSMLYLNDCLSEKNHYILYAEKLIKCAEFINSTAKRIEETIKKSSLE